MAKSSDYDDAEMDMLFEGADINHDQKISFDEFVQLMKMCYL